MRKLILMRHAKAEGAAASGDDFDRALTGVGLADAALMGRVLAQAGLKPDLALVSSATRTRQTWEAVAPAFGDLTEARFDRRLYNASAEGLRRAVEAVEEEAETLMVVGHNPGVPMLMLSLMIEAAESASAMDRARSKFPTASVVTFDFDAAMRPSFDNLWLAKDHGGGGDE